MKKRVLSILLCLCMVLMLVPATAFAETPSERYSLTLNFKYGTLDGQTGSYVLLSDSRAGEPYDVTYILLDDITGYEPYKIVGVRSDTGDGERGWFTDHDIVLEVVYVVDGSLAITVEGFEVGKTPNDCTYTLDSTIPGVTFRKDDIIVPWEKYVSYGEGYAWTPVGRTEEFETGTRYRFNTSLNNKGLELAPAVTVNGKTPEYCAMHTFNGVPYAIGIICEFGTPPEPVPTITIDGPDVICAQQNYYFTATAPEGVTLDKGFGFDTGGKGSGVDLTIDENGVGHGVMLTEWYDLNTNYFDLSVYGYTADQQFVSATKRVQVSQDHVYVDGVCGCGAVLQYIVEYIGSGDDPICMDTKTHGEPLTLRGETFTMDGFVQTGWIDKETGAIYELGATYDEDRDATLYPYWEKLVTVTADFTTTVALGGCKAPGETAFELALIDGAGNELSYDGQYFFAEITTNGAGSYNGTMTITATGDWLYDMLYEGAFIWQYDGEEEGWTYDDTVWGVRLYMPEVEARSVDAAQYSLLIYPACVADNGSFDLDLNAGPVDKMSFTNTYTDHFYELKHDATNHWDECQCKDVQNKELHKYGDWKVTKEATQTAKGEKEHTCTVCGYTEKAEIPVRTNVPSGDDSSFALWAALFTLSAAAVITTATVSKKKKASK